MKAKIRKEMTELLLLANIEERQIERVFVDGAEEEILKIYNGEFAKLKSTWDELPPDTWKVLLSMFKGTEEKKTLSEQRKNLKKAWKTIFKDIIEKAKTKNEKESSSNESKTNQNIVE